MFVGGFEPTLHSFYTVRFSVSAVADQPIGPAPGEFTRPPTVQQLAVWCDLRCRTAAISFRSRGRQKYSGRNLHECVTRLARLPGVGQWTAHYIAMRELREPDAFPVGDIGLTRAITRLARQPLTSGELLEKAERWRPWRAYAAQHLWASEMPARRTA
jgi:hypothetical protein